MDPNIIGFLAGLLGTIAFLPQVIQVTKTKHTKDLSLPTYLILFSGVGLWLVYGILIKAPPLILTNTITLTLIGWIIALKVKYG